MRVEQVDIGFDSLKYGSLQHHTTQFGGITSTGISNTTQFGGMTSIGITPPPFLEVFQNIKKITEPIANTILDEYDSEDMARAILKNMQPQTYIVANRCVENYPNLWSLVDDCHDWSLKLIHETKQMHMLMNV